MEARRRKASAFGLRHSQSLASLRHLPSHANVLSTTQRFGKPTHVVALTGFQELRTEFEAKFNDGQWAIETYHPSDAMWRERLRAKARWIEQSIVNAQQAYGIDLCVMTALSSPELDAIRSLPWRWSEPEMLDPVTFLYRGEYSCEQNTFRVAAASCPRMGMVSASTLAQKLIQQVRPRILAMTGICAGVRGECELGDVLVASP
jgi:Phosphorylase superfamily